MTYPHVYQHWEICDWHLYFLLPKFLLRAVFLFKTNDLLLPLRKFLSKFDIALLHCRRFFLRGLVTCALLRQLALQHPVFLRQLLVVLVKLLFLLQIQIFVVLVQLLVAALVAQDGPST